jgi:deoxyribose-phosphate aldolase
MIINGITYDRDKIAGMIDFAVLDPNTTEKQVRDSVEIAKKYKVKGVHTNPLWMELVADLLEGTGMEAAIVAGFPFGAIPTAYKAHEVEQMIKALRGRPACIDFVTNVGALKGGDFKTYTDDIRTIVELGHAAGYEVKSIMETALLTDAELADGCKCAVEAGVDFVKTSSGRNGSPNVKSVKIMRANVPANVGVKFSGYGGFNPAQLTIMAIAAGATRLGTRRAPEIIDEIDTYYKGLNISDS